MAYTLKYFLEFYDPSETLYRTEILEDTTGTLTPIELEGAENPVSFTSPDKEDIYTPLVGSALTLRFIATEDFTLEDLYTESETRYMVKHYRGSVLLWQGFIIPDGAQQSWVTRVWEIQLDCVDGLGLLKNLGFVNNDSGNNFNGKQSALQVIVNCLKRTSLPMNINTSVNIFYSGLLPAFNSNPSDLDPLALTYIQVERFYKDDEETPMNCDEVLKSVLDEFRSVIVQRRGEWYICRWNELYALANISFRAYNSIGSRLTNKTVNLNQSIYSYDGTNNTTPHHSNENQLIILEKAYKKLSINYQYGVVKTLINNSDFSDWPVLSTTPASWAAYGGIGIFRPTTDIGYGLGISGTYNEAKWVQSTATNIDEGDIIVFDLTVRRRQQDGNLSIPRFVVVLTNGTDVYRLFNTTDGQGVEWYLWTSGTVSNGVIIRNGEQSIQMISPQAPISGTAYVELYADEQGWDIIYKYVSLTPGSVSNQVAKGEYHEVTQPGNYSFVPDNLVVFNGDGESDIFVGTVYKANQSTPTSTWHRFGFSESKPLLQIAAEDTLRMFQRQRRKFTGNFYGYFDYLSVIEIIGLTGKYVPTGMSFDFATNQGSFTLREIIADELPGITYELKPDYGNSIKPVIR